MKLLNLNKHIGIRTLLFPDNQPHLVVEGIEANDDVSVIVSLTDSITIMHLLQVSNALEHLGAKKEVLVIPYLMAARYDRLMQNGDSFDLEVIAGLINSCSFKKVMLFDVHSEVSLRLIKNSVNITNRRLVEHYGQHHAVVICPDTGASNKVNEYLGWNNNLKEIIYCNKKRELSSGKLTLEVNNPDKCENRNCVIIDDICDGGATFLAIANQIKPKHLTLIVTHGIFSKGFSALEESFDEIITSNSYNRNYSSRKVSTIDIGLNDFIPEIIKNEK
jgi:ribose-phosphate pyrophosphokinase